MSRTGRDIREAAALLHEGELVAIPTETVYGLAGNALDEKAVLAIFKAKNRPKFDPLILHTDSLEKVEGLVAGIPPRARELARAFWPGPLTLLLEKSPAIPDLVTSGLPRVAVRVPDHPLTLSLLRRLSFPLAAPSANPFGYVSPTTASHVEDQLGDRIPYILDGGAASVGVESTIVGFEEGAAVIYRLGGTNVEEIERVAGPVEIKLNQSSNPAAPGMLKTHYAPGKPLVVGDIPGLVKQYGRQRLGIVSFHRSFPPGTGRVQIQLSPGGSLEEAAGNLFAALREMDRPDLDMILAEKLPDEGLGRAINDRLLRASAPAN